MANNLFNRYIWLVDTIARAKQITYDEINEQWQRNESLNPKGENLALRTFHNHRMAIEELFDINIECNPHNGYRYYIENADDLKRNNLRTWLINTFAVNNLIHESYHLKQRILFEYIPSGQQFLTPIIAAMRDSRTITFTYQRFSQSTPTTLEAEPWCVKVCRQRWYMLAGGLAYPQPRIYALDRIIDLETTDHRFTLPPDFDAEAYFRHSFGIVVNEKYLPETVKLKVYDERVCYLRTLPLHQSQTETESGDNYAVFNYFLSQTNDFQHKLLSIGESVEVLEPQWLRHEICRAARKTVQRNK